MIAGFAAIYLPDKEDVGVPISMFFALSSLLSQTENGDVNGGVSTNLEEDRIMDMEMSVPHLNTDILFNIVPIFLIPCYNVVSVKSPPALPKLTGNEKIQ